MSSVGGKPAQGDPEDDPEYRAAQAAVAAKDAVTARVGRCPAHSALVQHAQDEFSKAVIKVVDGVHVAVGFAVSNSILLEAPDGVVIVDTTETLEGANEICQEFRRLSDKPVKAIIYTHAHADHTGGAQAFVDNTDDVDIWAHEKFSDLQTYETLIKGVSTPRTIRQFGLGLPAAAVVSCGLGRRCNPGPYDTTVKPTRFMKGSDTKNVSIAGLDMYLLHLPGESACHMGVWIPSKKVFLSGDTVCKTFPNLYAIRGQPARSFHAWIESIDKIRNLFPCHLVPSHGRPIAGQETVSDVLTSYRDAIQYVHDQTVRLLSRGLHPTEVARRVTLPPTLKQHKYLQEFYGRVEWSSLAVYDAYLGWFSGAPEDLFPLTPTERGQKMVASFGVSNLLAEAEVALTTESDPQWALELASCVLNAQPDCADARDIRTRALLALAADQTSANARNYLLTCLLEDHGAHPSRYPTAKTVFAVPLPQVFQIMACSIKAEEEAVQFTKLTVVIVFSDQNDDTYSFYVRNGILEVEKLVARPRDLFINMSTKALRKILSGLQSVEECYNCKKIEIDRQPATLFAFFSCFENVIVNSKQV